ncbi:L-fucose mutarotase [Gracilibacillus orientalis]|uniref:L-fucose mutarotase n=1 Tax=Gracilibacillus orientalis TaxID=334253 RepID=A0A1I4JTM2_9BACI|nr:RbsD/FucU domain-containing protein [Gracilibacillus orientalis]SFL69814.1 L-fucose mutarotase [Gracilibacillus orientalis]
MLKRIPNILSPDLLKTLHEMGHGDEIVIGDGNFPAANYANRLIRCDGHNIPDLLAAILELLPLDTFVDKPVTLMQVVDEQNEPTPEIWHEYKDILSEFQVAENQIDHEERFAFYERSKRAYAIIATTEKALYANIILKKGVIS